MADAKIPHMDTFDPNTRRAFQYVQAVLNNMGQQGNISPVGATPPPQPHAALSVKGGASMVDVKMTDPSDQYRGNENFFDYSFDGFKTFHTKHVGAANNWRGSLGSGMVSIRSYAQQSTSAPSAYTYHPPVDTSGTAEPEFQANAGSGTGTKGYGEQPYTSDNPPVRA